MPMLFVYWLRFEKRSGDIKAAARARTFHKAPSNIWNGYLARRGFLNEATKRGNKVLEKLKHLPTKNDYRKPP